LDVAWFLAGVGAAGLVLAVWVVRDRRNAVGESEPQRDERRSLERQLLDALDALPIGVVVVAGVGHPPVRNRRAMAMSGVRHVDVLVDRAVEDVLEAALDSGGSERELEVSGPPTRHFSIRAIRLAEGEALAVVEDTTERVRVDTVRTDFVANLSHELKTPIGGIAALSDTMVDERDPEVVRRLAERIVQESHRMAGIVDDLLDLSRIEFGVADDWGPVDVHGVVREVVSTLQATSARVGIEVRASGSSPDEVNGDRAQLVSAVSNLVENAIKYSEPGGSVVVHTNGDDDWVRITVSDEGIGIAAEHHERIFERFFRVDKARSRSTGGTGLGLSIVRHVVDNHGGRIEVRSAEGEGATFVVSLPRRTREDS